MSKLYSTSQDTPFRGGDLVRISRDAPMEDRSDRGLSGILLGFTRSGYAKIELDKDSSQRVSLSTFLAHPESLELFQ